MVVTKYLVESGWIQPTKSVSFSSNKYPYLQSYL